MESMLKNAVAGILPTDDQVLSLADYDNTRALADAASLIRDQGFQYVVTYLQILISLSMADQPEPSP